MTTAGGLETQIWITGGRPLWFGREIVSGSPGIRRGTGSPRRKELRLPQNRTKRIATTLEKRICCGRKRGLIFFPHPLTNRIATTQKSDEKNCDYPGKTDLLRPKKGSNLFFPQHRPSSPRPQECQKCQRIALATSVSTRVVKKCLGDLSFHTSCQKMSWRPQFPPELSKKCFGDLSFPNSCCPNVVASMFLKWKCY